MYHLNSKKIAEEKLKHLKITDDLVFRNIIEMGDNCLHLLQALYDMINGKINLENNFVNDLQSGIDEISQDPEWRAEFMNLQMRYDDINMRQLRKPLKLRGLKRLRS